MKVKDILSEKHLYTPNQSDEGAKEMDYPNVYTNKDIGGKTKLRKEKVVVRNSKNGVVYGMRTLVQKAS